MRQLLFVALVVLLVLFGVKYSIAQTVKRPDGSSVAFGGFVDAYYAYDFNRPAEFDRPRLRPAPPAIQVSANASYWRQTRQPVLPAPHHL